MSITGVTASSRRKVPNAPTIGTATDVGTSRAYNNGAATVTFTPDPTGFEATSYTATSSPGGFTTTGSSSPLTVTGLQSNTAYTFTVTATNFVGTGSASAPSNSITATTVPQAPTVGTPTVATGQTYTGSATVAVPFTAGATGGKTVTAYNLTSSSTNTAVSLTSPFNISEIVGTARTYVVTSTNANGTSAASSTSSSVTPLSVPQAPTASSTSNVAGRPFNSPQASVAFTANATGGTAITGYTVTSSSGASNTGATSPILVTESAAGTYNYTVTATNSQGTSSASNTVSTSVAAVPTAPTIGTLSYVLNITYGSNPQFYISFTAPTSDGGSAITGYKYSTDGGTTYGTIASTTSPLTVPTQGNGSAFAAGTSYTVILKATNSNGDSPASSASNSLSAATVPNQPTVTNTSTGSTNLTLNYNYNTGGTPVTSYVATVAPTISTSVTGTSPVGNTSGSLSFTGSYIQGTNYSANLTVTNAVGTSTSSNATGTTPYAATVPGAPASLSAAVASTTSVTLTYGAISQNGSALTAWTGTGTSTGDIVSTPAINLTYSGTPSTSGGTVSVTGTFSAAQSYTFTLKARNSVGQGSGATSGSVTPLPSITDNFNRTTSGSLGTSSSGSTWVAQKGTWYANGTVATSADAASNYSLATVGFGNANATVSATTSPGCGPAFWVSAANSFWAAVSYTSSSTYSCNCSSGCNSCVTYSCTSCVSYSCTNCVSSISVQDHTYNTSSGGLVSNNGGSYSGVVYAADCSQSFPSYSFPAGTRVYSSYYTHYCSQSSSGGTYPSCSCGTTTNFSSGGTYGVGSGCTCGTTTSYSAADASCNCATNGGGGGSYVSCSTCTQYNSYIRLISSVNGTVSYPTADVSTGAAYATNTSWSSQVQAIKVTTSGNAITARAYSDTGMSTLTGTLTYTPSSPTTSGNHGIIKAPNGDSGVQGSTVDNFSAS